MESVKKERVFNFSAGPAVLPVPVLEKAADEMLSFEGCGMSVMEMSHRSKPFESILARAEGGLRRHLNVPDDYAILFLQGGASMQFAMIPLNLYIEGKPVDVLNTGVWSQKALDEIQKIGTLRLAGSTEQEKFRRLPRKDEIKFSADASYVHMVSNNTIAGTQWKEFPDTGSVPLVADMSSDILSRPVDVKRFGLIFAGAQKNIGPSGVCAVIIRKDLAERASAKLPTMFQYRTFIKNNSLYNTPPTFAIYIIALVMEWITEQGGVEALEKRNTAKAKILYDVLDSSGFYWSPVEKSDRSLMNVVFRLPQDKEEALEKPFLEGAKKAGLSGLKGHRLVGGFRASIYNAHPVEGVQALAAYLKDFERRNG